MIVRSSCEQIFSMLNSERVGVNTEDHGLVVSCIRADEVIKRFDD